MTLEQAKQALATALCATPGPDYRAANARRTRAYEFGERVLKILEAIGESGDDEVAQDIIAAALEMGLIVLEADLEGATERYILVGPNRSVI